MRLRDLDAEFIAYFDNRPTGGYEGSRCVATIAQANGLCFQCPKCAEGKERGEEYDALTDRMLGFVRGAHYIICWFRNPQMLPAVGPEVDPKPGRWWAVGTSIDDLTFEHGEPPMPKSILLQGGCNWHGHLTNGDAA